MTESVSDIVRKTVKIMGNTQYKGHILR